MALGIVCLGLYLAYAGTGKDMALFPSGIRLSNPGNIKHSERNHWEGMTRLQDHPKMVRFERPYYGIRAIAKLLINYKKLHNCETITDIINRYAPYQENNTNAYIRDVSARSGFFPNELLDMHDVYTLVRLAQAITIHENGTAPLHMPPAWYEEDLYTDAVKDALDED